MLTEAQIERNRNRFLNSVLIRHLRLPLTKNQLRSLEPECKMVQFTEALSEREYKIVANLLKGRPDVTLRVYSLFADTAEDMQFLRFFPHIKRFSFDVFEFKTWEGLQYLPGDLEYINIGWTRSKAHSLQFLSRFQGLKKLSTEGHTKGIQAISDLKNLRDVTLRSITLPDLSLLVGLKNLVNLDLKLGGTKKLDLLPELNGLQYLELWIVRGLNDISPIGSLHELQRIHLESLKQVKRLPDMSKLTELKSIVIQNLKGLTDLTPLRNAPALEDLSMWDSRHMKPEHFECLVGHPTLQRLSLAIGGKKKDALVEKMLGMSISCRLDRYRRYFT